MQRLSLKSTCMGLTEQEEARDRGLVMQIAGAVTRASVADLDVRWFAWREIQEALAHGRAGGIALHHFRYDLRRFGLSLGDPACHILSADRAALVVFAGQFGLPEFLIKPPRSHRPTVWHFDAFGRVLERLQAAYPLPAGIDEEDGLTQAPP